MRAVVAALLVAVLAAVLAACGGDDDDAVEVGLTPDRADVAVNDVQLGEDDLGDGWSSAPDDEDDPVGLCIGTTITNALDAATIATSSLDRFERAGDERFSSTLVSVRTIAVDDGDVLDDVVDVIVDPGFAECLGTRFERLVSDGESELRLQVGDADADERYLQLDGVRSTSVAISFHADAPGFDFDAEMDVVAIARDQLLSLLLTVQLRDDVDGEDIARWAGLLADRQRIAQSSR